MCDFSGKLIAWLDRELPEAEAAEVQRHLNACMECRDELEAWKQVSKTFDAYCSAVMAGKVRNHAPNWAPVLAGAAAAVAVLLMAFPRARIESPPLRLPTRVASPAVVAQARPLPTRPLPIHKTGRRHAPAPVRNQAANLLPSGPYIEIAIPADAMFPPGAFPEGVTFIADLSIAADGSPQQLRLRP